jgi:putative ATP-dependent endonuclease of OLD family
VGDVGGGPTLEPQILAANDRASLNELFGTTYDADDELRAYMRSNKTSCALKILEASPGITMPAYIRDAVG